MDSPGSDDDDDEVSAATTPPASATVGTPHDAASDSLGTEKALTTTNATQELKAEERSAQQLPMLMLAMPPGHHVAKVGSFETIDVKPALKRMRSVRETKRLFLNMTPRETRHVSSKPVSLLQRRTPGDDGAVERWIPYFKSKHRVYSDFELNLKLARHMFIFASLLVCSQARNKKEGLVSWGSCVFR